jgi:hypothetical protein
MAVHLFLFCSCNDGLIFGWCIGSGGMWYRTAKQKIINHLVSSNLLA